ncbi:MAG: hypothetical protein PHW45_04330 [Candidatus ainarchaeum sp.]|nr:hypothetical protein [Candidatus ainarchaeum sp.]
MIKGIFLLSGSNFFGEALQRLSEMGLFAYILPIMLIFALVFGILTKLKIFEENKSVNAIIAISVALMSIQFDFVNVFFSELFPRMGVGLAIILALIILLGLFIPNKSWATYTILGVSGVIFIIVLVKTSSALGWSSGYWWYYNWEYVAVAIFILILFGLALSSGGSKTPEKDPMTLFRKSLFGG